MRTQTRAWVGAAAVLTAGVLVLATGPGILSAAPGAPQARGEAAAKPPGDEVKSKVKDNRTGELAPTSLQRRAGRRGQGPRSLERSRHAGRARVDGHTARDRAISRCRHGGA